MERVHAVRVYIYILHCVADGLFGTTTSFHGDVPPGTYAFSSHSVELGWYASFGACGGNPSLRFPRLPEFLAVAGPVVAAACYVPPEVDIRGIQDSKKVPTKHVFLTYLQLLQKLDRTLVATLMLSLRRTLGFL